MEAEFTTKRIYNSEDRRNADSKAYTLEVHGEQFILSLQKQ